MRVLLAVTLLALILIEVLFTEAFEALLLLVDDLVGVEALQAGEPVVKIKLTHVIDAVAETWLGVLRLLRCVHRASSICIPVEASNHLEEGVLSQTVCHYLRLRLRFEVKSVCFSRET